MALLPACLVDFAMTRETRVREELSESGSNIFYYSSKKDRLEDGDVRCTSHPLSGRSWASKGWAASLLRLLCHQFAQGLFQDPLRCSGDMHRHSKQQRFSSWSSDADHTGPTVAAARQITLKPADPVKNVGGGIKGGSCSRCCRPRHPQPAPRRVCTLHKPPSPSSPPGSVCPSVRENNPLQAPNRRGQRTQNTA